MLVSAVAAYRAWLAEGGVKPSVVAGHSLGEYSALVASGVLTLAQAAPLVRLRAAANIEGLAGRGPINKIKRRYMRACEVNNMDVVTLTRPITRVIVVAKHIEMRATPNSDLGDVGHQIVGNAVGILANLSRGVRPHRIEIA